MLQVFTDEAIFEKPLEASSLRVMPKKPTDEAPEEFEFALDIFCCYQQYTSELGNFE
jgi:hypothetical protein